MTAELIAKLEAARGPDRGLDATIYHLLHGEIPVVPDIHSGGERVSPQVPFYTFSIDAALTLVPEGYNKTLSELENGHRRADIWKPDDRAMSFYSDRGGTTAIALCIAALRAHRRGEG